jgi:hypothetical protein
LADELFRLSQRFEEGKATRSEIQRLMFLADVEIHKPKNRIQALQRQIAEKSIERKRADAMVTLNPHRRDLKELLKSYDNLLAKLRHSLEWELKNKKVDDEKKAQEELKRKIANQRTGKRR